MLAFSIILLSTLIRHNLVETLIVSAIGTATYRGVAVFTSMIIYGRVVCDGEQSSKKIVNTRGLPQQERTAAPSAE